MGAGSGTTAPQAARSSLHRRLTGYVMLTTGISLVVACTVFVLYDAHTGKANLVERSSMLARVVGINSAVALTFEDKSAAEETLAGLAAAQEVLAAAIYDGEGHVFATWSPAPGFEAPAREEPGHRFEGQQLHVYQQIVFQNQPVGSIYLRLDTSSLTRRVQWYAAIVAMLLGAAGFGAWGVAAWLRRQIARPLEQVVESSRAISEGDLSRSIATTRDDEIGVLARTFNAMTAGLRDLVAQVRQSTGEVAEVVSVLEERGGKLYREAQRQSAAIGESADSVDQLTGSIREVNSNVEQLADASQETSSSIMEMDASIGEIASHMDHLTSAIDTTSAAVSQVTANIDQVVSGVDTLQSATNGMVSRVRELSSSVQQVNTNAGESHALSEDSSREAGEGMVAVSETIEAMSDISSHFVQLQECVSRLAHKSQSIDEIVQVIKDVAEQTGLLSLNAAIIAAQAGEHGKAFSVVAEQVNALADRTHRSAREIAELILAVQEDTRAAVSAVGDGSSKVSRGVDRSRAAGRVLEKIIEKTHTSTERVHAIVEATARQTEDLGRVDQAMRDVQEIVDQINQSTHQQHTATNEIARAVENIRNLGTAVRHSTEEQRRGSRLITNAAANVTAMVSQIAEATNAQTKSSETIQHALQVFRDVSDETSRGAEEINASVTTLSERAERLEQEIGRFKTR
jgi:methyl-accepting chemotaxis protein